MDAAHSAPNWFVEPGGFDFLAWFSLAMIAGGIYGVFYLYALFDRWAEKKSEGTPLAKTIPTLLTIALLYEVFPLDHFSVLLPLSAILIAVMADYKGLRFSQLKDTFVHSKTAAVAPKPEPEPEPAPEPAQDPELKKES